MLDAIDMTEETEDVKSLYGFSILSFNEESLKEQDKTHYFTRLLLRLISEVFYQVADHFKWIEPLTEE